MGKRKKRRPAAKRAAPATEQPRRKTGAQPAAVGSASSRPAPATDSPIEWVHRPDRRGAALAFGIAALAGSMWVLAAPRFDLWPLAWVAITPLLWLIDRAPTARRARRAAWVCGTAMSAGGFFWIIELLTRHSSIPWPLALLGLLLLSAYQGLVFWLFGMSVFRARQFSRERLGRPLPMVVVAPLAMVTFETIVPVIFPFSLAVTQAWQTPVIQIAEITGPVGVTSLLVAFGAAVYDVASERSLRRRLVPAAAAATLLGLCLGFGFVRMGQIDERRAKAPRLTVGLVQGNIPMDGSEAAQDGFPVRVLLDLQRASRDLERRGAELIVWSESGYPYWVPRHPLPAVAEAAIRRDPLALSGHDCLKDTSDLDKTCWKVVAPQFSVPLVMGATTYRAPHDPEDFPHNSALFVDGDLIEARFDKSRLVMFSEHIPFRDTIPAIAKIMPRGSGHFEKGTEIVTFPLRRGGVTYRLAPMICFEDTLADFGRELAEHRPHLLVNLTNDTWFGDTSEPWQHLGLSVFRAVEMRTDLVRAVNSGVSAFIDANGRVVTRSDAIDPASRPMEMEGLLGEVTLIEGGHTFYARFGEAFAYLCTAALFILWIGWPVLVRRRVG